MIGSSLKSACGHLEEIEMESLSDIGYTFVTLMLGKWKETRVVVWFQMVV